MATNDIIFDRKSGHLQPCFLWPKQVFLTIAKWFLCLNPTRAIAQYYHKIKLNLKKCKVAINRNVKAGAGPFFSMFSPCCMGSLQVLRLPPTIQRQSELPVGVSVNGYLSLYVSPVMNLSREYPATRPNKSFKRDNLLQTVDRWTAQWVTQQTEGPVVVVFFFLSYCKNVSILYL